jgi:DNA-binding IclR family transcriptional regulator
MASSSGWRKPLSAVANLSRALGVSDATATRYLQTLEDQGQIVQRQDTGRGVYYEKVNK